MFEMGRIYNLAKDEEFLAYLERLEFLNKKGKQMDNIENFENIGNAPMTEEELMKLLAQKPDMALTSDEAEPTEDELLN